MKILYQDLLSFLSYKPSIKELSEKLFQLGHEHEIHGEIFEMEFTPNRGDCLSLLGLSRDLKPFFGASESKEVFNGDIATLDIDFINESPKDCKKISFLEVEIDKDILEYEPYLDSYFQALDIKKSNFFTDISNYISYELGQPTHCYDSSFLVKNKITFKNISLDDDFDTLLGTTVKLNNKNCIFVNDDKIINLAGVMGGISTACSKKTRKVLIECAYFEPESIIGKSLKYNIVSEAAHKFERGVDIDCHDFVIRRFLKIIQDHAKVKSIKTKTFLHTNQEKISLPINICGINKILGTSLNESEYVTILRNLNISVGEQILIPFFRHDIRSQNDLAEEVARVIGYNNISNQPINLKKNFNEEGYKKEELIEYHLLKNGFNEVINFPFTSQQEKNSIIIDNPLDSSKDKLRLNLKDSLIKNLLDNERRQKDSIKLFEISDVYEKNIQQINHFKKLGLIVSGRLGNNFRDFSKKLDKRYLSKIINHNLPEELYTIEEINRDNLPTKRKDKIFYVEVLLTEIPELFYSNVEPLTKNFNVIKYKEVSDFPYSRRDFSFLIKDYSKVDLLIKSIESVNDDNLVKSFMFDFYYNKILKEVKIGYRFIFQSSSKTLTEEEVNVSVKKIINPILKIKGISIPGMQ
jgi:phenylalanyl-tRNA synthetase beta chain